MSLVTTLVEAMKEAMKAHDQATLDTIRFLRAQIKNEEIDLRAAAGGQDVSMTDEQVQKIVKKVIKQWQDDSNEYQKGGRADLVAETTQKIAILTKYLPAQLSREQVVETINQIRTATGLNQPGPLIGQVMAKIGNQTDGGVVAELVKEVLSQN